jgi:hypothetical protein
MHTHSLSLATLLFSLSLMAHVRRSIHHLRPCMQLQLPHCIDTNISFCSRRFVQLQLHTVFIPLCASACHHNSCTSQHSSQLTCYHLPPTSFPRVHRFSRRSVFFFFFFFFFFTHTHTHTHTHTPHTHHTHTTHTHTQLSSTFAPSLISISSTQRPHYTHPAVYYPPTHPFHTGSASLLTRL